MENSSKNSGESYSRLDIMCKMCDKHLSYYNREPDAFIPPIQELIAMGAVPVPNLGWFCSQSCADQFEKEYGVKFQRDSEGKVRYYP